MLKSVNKLVQRMSEHHPDAIAFRYYCDEIQGIKEITYSKYARDIVNTGYWLTENIPDIEGKHIAFMAKNSYEYAVFIMATIACKAVVVPLNIEKTVAEIRYEIENSEADIIISDGVYCDRNPGFTDEITIPVSLLRPIEEEAPTGWYFTEDDSERMALIIYTSGTTAASKGVMVCQRALFHSANYVVDVFDKMNMGAPRYFFVLPMYHTSGLFGLFTMAAIGAAANMCLDMMFLYRDLGLMNSDITFVSPIVVNSWYKDIKRGKIDRLGGIKNIFCGGAALNCDMVSTFTENGILISQGYAMTEAGSICGNTLTSADKIESVGKEAEGVEIKIVGGEICVRSLSVMMGYYNDKVATDNAVVDGWLYTGDLGYKDDDGFYYITGRKKNTIILDSGENVQPEILEKRIMECEYVGETIVHEKSGRICATIVSKKAMYKADIEDYIKNLNRELPTYARISIVEFSDNELAKTSTGKIKRGQK